MFIVADLASLTKELFACNKVKFSSLSQVFLATMRSNILYYIKIMAFAFLLKGPLYIPIGSVVVDGGLGVVGVGVGEVLIEGGGGGVVVELVGEGVVEGEGGGGGEVVGVVGEGVVVGQGSMLQRSISFTNLRHSVPTHFPNRIL